MQVEKGHLGLARRIGLLTVLVMLSLSGCSAPSVIGSNGKRVLIVGDGAGYSVNMQGLLIGEGFEVEFMSVGWNDASLLMTFDAIVFNHYSSSVDTMLLAPVVSSGTGVFILPSREGDPIVTFAGVVEADGDGMSTTSRFQDHPVMEGVVSMWVKGKDLNTFSSSAYPLVLGNDVEYGTTDPILAVANGLGSGKIILLYQEKYFDSYLGSEDNALFFKNCIYWITHLEVPEFTSNIPLAQDIEDEIEALNEDVLALAQSIDEIAYDIGNISNIDVLEENMTGLSSGFDSVSGELEALSSGVSELQDQVAELSSSVSEIQESLSEMGESSDIVELSNRVSVLTAQLDVLERELHSQQPQDNSSILLYASPVALVVAVAAVVLALKKQT